MMCHFKFKIEISGAQIDLRNFIIEFQIENFSLVGKIFVMTEFDSDAGLYFTIGRILPLTLYRQQTVMKLPHYLLSNWLHFDSWKRVNVSVCVWELFRNYHKNVSSPHLNNGPCGLRLVTHKHFFIVLPLSLNCVLLLVTANRKKNIQRNITSRVCLGCSLI